MPTITVFLLVLIGVLISANALLWLTEKRNKMPKQSCRANFFEIPEASDLQNNEIRAILEQVLQLKECLGENNGFLTEIRELKNQQENIFSRLIALEEATIQTQNELSEIKSFRNTETVFFKNRGEFPKSDRIRILEEYLKKT